MPTFPFGVDFRATSTFVTDPSGYTYEIGTAPDYTSARGYGWTTGAALNARDRNAANDPRLAGMTFTTGDQFEIDLPAAGAYTLNLACGDPSYARSSQQIAVYDDTSLLSTLFTGASTGAANSFLDATGSVWTAAQWPSSNVAKQLSFTSTKCVFHVGDGTNFSYIASVHLAAAGGASPVWVPPRRRQTIILPRTVLI